MRHLFFVHSFTTYSCALGVIESEGLDADECIFVQSRGFICKDPPVGSLVLDYSLFQEPALTSLHSVPRALAALRSNDRKLRALCQDSPFMLYFPHTCYDLPHTILSHRNCSGLCYIEEGLTAYYTPSGIEVLHPTTDFNLESRIARKLFFRNRLPKQQSFYRTDYVCAYGLTEDSYPGWKRRKILGLPACLLASSGSCEGEIAGSPIIVFDAFVEARRTSVSALIRALERFLELLASEGTTDLRYKFHAGQSEGVTRAPIRRLFASWTSRIATHEFEPTTYLEEFFAAQKCPIYIFNSAAGLYASYAGRSVMTLNTLLARIDPDYNREIRKLPPVFAQRIKSVEAEVNHRA